MRIPSVNYNYNRPVKTSFTGKKEQKKYTEKDCLKYIENNPSDKLFKKIYRIRTAWIENEISTIARINGKIKAKDDERKRQEELMDRIIEDGLGPNQSIYF